MTEICMEIEIVFSGYKLSLACTILVKHDCVFIGELFWLFLSDIFIFHICSKNRRKILNNPISELKTIEAITNMSSPNKNFNQKVKSLLKMRQQFI